MAQVGLLSQDFPDRRLDHFHTAAHRGRARCGTRGAAWGWFQKKPERVTMVTTKYGSFFLRFMKFTAWFYIYICMFYLCWLKEWFWYVLMFWYGIYINGHIVQKRMVTQRLECDYLYCTNAENWTNKNGNATLINGHLSDWTNNMQRFEQPKSKHKAKQVWSRSKHFRPRGTTDQ